MRTEDQQVDELWRQLEAERPYQQQSYLNNNQVKSNRSGIACIDHAVITVKAGMPHMPAVPLHANEIQHIHPPAEITALPANHRYIAAQSPEADCTHFLIQGLDSQQGIYQFVSCKAHATGRDSGGPTITTMMCDRWAAKQTATMMLGERYEVTDLRKLDGMDGGADHIRHELVAIDRHSPEREVRTMLLTQAGLQFSGRVLQPAEIVRADALLGSHRSWCAEKNHAEGDNEARSNPMIASYAGIGRNAVLISYSDMCLRIESGSVNKENLDATLKSVIQAGRIARGPRFLHSRDQLAALRKTLLAKLNTQPASIPVSQRARAWVVRALQSCIPAASNQTGNAIKTQSAPVTPRAEHHWPRTEVARLRYPCETSHKARRAAPPVVAAEQRQPSHSETGEPEFSQQFPSSGKGNANRENVDASRASALIDVSEITPPPQNSGTLNAINDATDYESSNSDVTEAADLARADYQLSEVGVTFDNTKIDMSAINLQMSHHEIVGPHRIKKLASADNGSWWRAAFLSVFVDAFTARVDVPQRIHDKVLELGQDFLNEAQLLKNMTKEAVRSDRGLAEIMTNMPDVHHAGMPGVLDHAMGAAIFEASISQFKAVGEDDADPMRPGEQALKKVARALLLKGGVDRIKVERLFDHDPPHAGEEVHVIELMNQLGAERGSIFTRPWKSNDTAPASGKSLNLENATLSLFEAVSAADLATIGKLNRETLTNQVQRGMTSRPTVILDKNGPEIVGEDAHVSRAPDYFSVSVPKSVLLGGRLRGVKRTVSVSVS